MAVYLKYGGLIIIAALFMMLGIHVLMGAYRLEDPFSFMLTFFASNFIILISVSLLIGFAIRFWRLHTTKMDGKCEKGSRSRG